MSDLMAFLTARLDEDEQAAHGARGHESGEWFVGRKWNVYSADLVDPLGEEEHELITWGNVELRSEHIARHDPARVLREVVAKRAIIDMCSPDTLTPERYDAWQDALCHLANVYSDHPDYRSEWAE